jgi:hypothetical protein
MNDKYRSFSFRSFSDIKIYVGTYRGMSFVMIETQWFLSVSAYMVGFYFAAFFRTYAHK